MISIEADSANELYVEACEAVRIKGKAASPRGLETREVLGAHLCLKNPRRRFIDLPPNRIINPAFAVAEMLWIISGSDSSWIFDYNGRLREYADDGVLKGAYGPRIRRWADNFDQLDYVRRLLTRDPDSRQAVIQLFNPSKDTLGHRDVPCTLGYRFFLRSGSLHMHTSMRSQDLWLGFPYDIFTTTVLQEILAGWIGADVGEYHHFVDSLHLYSENIGPSELLSTRREPSAEMAPLDSTFEEFSDLLEKTVAGTETGRPLSPWSDFSAVMSSYRLWKQGNPEEARIKNRTSNGVLSRALERWYDDLEYRKSSREFERQVV